MNSNVRKFIISAQPYLSTYDYESSQSFFLKMNTLLSKIESKIPQDHESSKIIVLPETIGTWLAFSDCLKGVYNTNNMVKAALFLFMSYPFQIFKSMIKSILSFEWLRYGVFNSVKRILFRARSDHVFNIYTDVFSRLSRKYKAYIVAGSAFLPRCVIDKNYPCHVKNTKKGLYNLSFVFNPDGEVCMITEKKNIIPEEKFLDKSNLPLQSISTPAGNLSVVICSDSWSKQIHKELSTLNADILAVPVFVYPYSIWNNAWNGYTIDEKPDDVDLSDVKHSLEKDMWLKYSTPGRLKQSNIPYSVVSLAHSEIWDIHAGGQSYISNKECQILAMSKEYIKYEDILIHEI